MKGSRGFRIVFGIFSLAVFVAYFSLRYATSPKSSDFDDEHAFIYSEIKAVIDSGGDINEFLMNDPRYAFLQEDWQDIVDQNTDQQDARRHRRRDPGRGAWSARAAGYRYKQLGIRACQRRPFHRPV